uniref:Myb/SANT-like domain-containing protein n=1 Tax=Brassica oleracea var. oleracea TaxID=109376 RepID=A0A0D3CK98_BRAOL
MTSAPGTDSLAWTDEQTRFYLQLRIEEKLKGNDRKQNVNEAGRQSIIEKFFDAYGERHPWRKFGIKHTTCKTQYTKYKRLINKRTGLGFDAYEFIEMSDDWWNELFKEWPAAKKLKEKPIANIDLLEKVFGSVHISGAEGWAAQQGEDHLDQQSVDHQDHDDVIEIVADRPIAGDKPVGEVSVPVKELLDQNKDGGEEEKTVTYAVSRGR